MAEPIFFVIVKPKWGTLSVVFVWIFWIMKFEVWIFFENLLDLVNTKFDLNKDFEINKSFLESGGIDHNYVLKDNSLNKSIASIYSSITGIGVEYSTDQPGIQFYTGNMMKKSYKGKFNRTYGLQYGMCLETQIFPDAINQPDFPSTILKKGQTYTSNTKIKLRNDFN